jgi:hypothetical protein
LGAHLPRSFLPPLDRSEADGDAGLVEAERRLREIGVAKKALYNDFKMGPAVEEQIIVGILDPVLTRLRSGSPAPRLSSVACSIWPVRQRDCRRRR